MVLTFLMRFSATSYPISALFWYYALPIGLYARKHLYMYTNSDSYQVSKFHATIYGNHATL